MRDDARVRSALVLTWLLALLATFGGCDDGVSSGAPATNDAFDAIDAADARDADDAMTDVTDADGATATDVVATDASPDAADATTATDAAPDTTDTTDATLDDTTTAGDATDDGAATADDATDADIATDVDVTPAPPLPPLVSMDPAEGATVPRTAWLVLAFASEPDPLALGGLTLSCGAGTPAIAAESLGAGRVVVNPAGELPASAACTLAWTATDGAYARAFTVAGPGAASVVPYDRDDPSQLAPFPDDAFLVADAATPTGRRLELPSLDRPDDVTALLGALRAVLPAGLDGFSALAPLVFGVPDALDRATLPMTEAASLDPLATIGLFDVDPASPTYGARVAFDLILKDEPNADDTASHVLMVYPITPLRPRGHYALAVTRRALVDATRPLGPSAYTAAALRDPTTPSGAAAAVLGALHPALLPDDLALVVRVSIRSLDHTGADLLAIRAATFAAAAPTYAITKVTPGAAGSGLAAIVEGTWDALDWRDGDFLARDADGHPTHGPARPVAFVLALPASAATTPAPLVMYQHGNPGSALAEVPSTARDGLAAAGFAVAGFTDIINRELLAGADDINAYTAKVVQDIIIDHRVPDFVALLDAADQLSFIRLLGALGDLDVLPVGAPDGKPDLDPSAPLGYVGVSYGSFRGVGLLPFAPEIHAAALVVGGGRFSCTIVHQEADGPKPNHLYSVVTTFFPNVTRVELWSGVALAQAAADDQDWLTFASHLYADPYPLGTAARASVLLVEGLGDHYVPTYSTRAAATAMGLTQVGPGPDRVPTLAQSAAASLAGNIDAATTGGFLQYVAAGVPGYAPTPGCESRPEGHFCAQALVSPVLDRFFLSALDGVPTITP